MSNVHDFLGRVNANRRAHYVKEFCAYYGKTPRQAITSYQAHETLVAVRHNENLLAVVTSKSEPQYAGQPRLSNGFYRGIVAFYINPQTGAVYRESNGKMLRRGNVADSSYWACNLKPNETLDQQHAPEPYSLCVFRKNERLNRISKLKNYEL